MKLMNVRSWLAAAFACAVFAVVATVRPAGASSTYNHFAWTGPDEGICWNAGCKSYPMSKFCCVIFDPR